MTFTHAPLTARDISFLNDEGGGIIYDQQDLKLRLRVDAVPCPVLINQKVNIEDRFEAHKHLFISDLIPFERKHSWSANRIMVDRQLGVLNPLYDCKSVDEFAAFNCLPIDKIHTPLSD